MVALGSVVAISWPRARAEPPTAALPAVLKAEPAPEWNAKFTGKKGWIGGDGVYSAVIGSRRVLWLFGDTLLGAVKDGRRDGAVMVNNTVGIQAGQGADAALRFVAGETKERKPAALLTPADGKGWFWPHATVRIGDRLFLFLMQIVKTKEEGAFGFQQVGECLAVVENPDDKPRMWRMKQHKVPFTEFGRDRERSWGSSVLRDGEHLYVYGYETRGKGIGKRRLLAARAPVGSVEDFKTWRFRTSKGWSDKSEEAVTLADGFATEFSVCPMPGQKNYVAVYTENGLSDRIMGRFADTPAGPWSAPVLLYKCPEMAKDKGVFSYAAKAHRWAARDDLLISYCVNSWEFARLFRDEAVYRPKFVRVKLRPAK